MIICYLNNLNIWCNVIVTTFLGPVKCSRTMGPPYLLMRGDRERDAPGWEMPPLREAWQPALAILA